MICLTYGISSKTRKHKIWRTQPVKKNPQIFGKSPFPISSSSVFLLHTPPHHIPALKSLASCYGTQLAMGPSSLRDPALCCPQFWCHPLSPPSLFIVPWIIPPLSAIPSLLLHLPECTVRTSTLQTPSLASCEALWGMPPHHSQMQTTAPLPESIPQHSPHFISMTTFLRS